MKTEYWVTSAYLPGPEHAASTSGQTGVVCALWYKVMRLWYIALLPASLPYLPSSIHFTETTTGNDPIGLAFGPRLLWKMSRLSDLCCQLAEFKIPVIPIPIPISISIQHFTHASKIMKIMIYTIYIHDNILSCTLSNSNQGGSQCKDCFSELPNYPLYQHSMSVLKLS